MARPTRTEQRQQRLAAALDAVGNEFAAQFPLPAPAVQAPMAVEGNNNNNNAAAEHNDDAVGVAPMVIDNNDALEDVAADADPPAAGVLAVNLNLDAIRQRFRDPRAILRASRGESTFGNHQRENTKLIFYIYENDHQLLNDQFYHQLRQVDVMIDYNHITQPRRPYRGILTEEQRIVKHREHCLRTHICTVLGEPGTRATQQTIDLDAFTDNPEHFVNFITTRVKDTGELMKPGVYSGYKSNLAFLFKRYRYTPRPGYNVELKEYMDGVKRIANEARAAGEGNIYDGALPLPWPLYQDVNDWFMKDGTEMGVFGGFFSSLTVNLACRGDNTKQVCVKHMMAAGDSFMIPFSHEKCNQTGDDMTKRLPRHIYANPLDVSADFVSKVFHYLVLHPDLVGKPNNSILKGNQEAATQKFNRVVKKVLQANVDAQGVPLCESKHGVPLPEITMYSWRKCAHTKLNCGSTAGPTSAAACLREGKSLGTTRDPYIAQEMASDRLTGRILAGLPINMPQFAASFPDFVPIDVLQSVQEGGVPADIYAAKKAEVDAIVREVLDAIFGPDNMAVYPSIHPFLRIGLASHLHHFDAINRMIPANGELRRTPLFTNARVMELKQHVRIAMPWDDHAIYFAEATGLMPCHVQLNNQMRMEKKIDELPSRFERLLDQRQMNGPVTYAQMQKLVDNSPVVNGLVQTVNSMRVMLEGRLLPADSTSANSQGAVPKYHVFPHPDGKQRRIPVGWEFPKGTLQSTYINWHCGDPAKKISPIKLLDNRDFSTAKLKKRGKRTHTELKRLMGFIDKAATDKGVPPKAQMTQAEAQHCFSYGLEGIELSLQTPTGRPRDVCDLKWQSVLRFLPKNSV